MEMRGVGKGKGSERESKKSSKRQEGRGENSLQPHPRLGGSTSSEPWWEQE